MLDIVGWLGAFFFAICAIPQAWQSYKLGNSDGISTMFLVFWFLGEVLMTIYVLPTWDWPLLTNYIFNLILTSVICWYKIFPTRV